jgi:hypothetical protein
MNNPTNKDIVDCCPRAIMWAFGPDAAFRANGLHMTGLSALGTKTSRAFTRSIFDNPGVDSFGDIVMQGVSFIK